MYAIIRDGSHQYKVEEGQQLEVDYRSATPGDAVTFDDVLAIGGNGEAKVGTPTVAGASVAAEVVGTVKGPKLTVQKLRRRKTFRKRTGHRQFYTRVKINKITAE